jgi:hypothetical protein
MVPASADSGDGNNRSDHIVVQVTLQAGKKDANRRFVTSYNNYGITAVPTLQHCAGNASNVEGISFTDSTAVDSFVT